MVKVTKQEVCAFFLAPEIEVFEIILENIILPLFFPLL